MSTQPLDLRQENSVLDRPQSPQFEGTYECLPEKRATSVESYNRLLDLLARKLLEPGKEQ